jgi:hypothetical protein
MGANFCPSCGKPAAAATSYCAHCGARLSLAVPAPAPAALPYATPAGRAAAPGLSPEPAYAPSAVGAPPYPLPLAPAYGRKPPVSQGMAVAALILNILIWPGLGSLIAGENVGWAQGFLMLFGLVLSLVLIGIPLVIAAWIWGIVTGVQQRAAP